MTFTPLTTPAENLGKDLAKIITDAGIYAPRSQQVYLGPSEVGEKCTRKLAYKLLAWDKVNEGSNGNWASQVGTAIHSHLEKIFSKMPERYEVESKVKIRANLSGTIDLFDKELGIVLDWKTTSPSNLQVRKREGATDQNIIQTMLYAYGKAQQGATVNFVGLVYLPTGGQITDMYVELHPYDEQIALDALTRLDSIYTLLSTVDVEANPQMWAMIPTAPSRLCNYCPYFQPFSDDPSKACAGDTK
ncbi:MAG: PD-(D/E)XK nuclease family protein [Actinomycetes bacterium]|jgi:hypothetical protein